jgi:thiol-disulfide isomerase/thioredoxin
MDGILKIFAFLFVLFMLVVFIWQWRSQRKAQQMVDRKAPDTSTVDGAIDAPKKVYFFHAHHCRPCRVIEPLVDEVRAQQPNLIKIEIGEHIELARAFQVAATPSFVAVENGTIKAVRLGAVDKQWLNSRL